MARVTHTSGKWPERSFGIKFRGHFRTWAMKQIHYRTQ